MGELTTQRLHIWMKVTSFISALLMVAAAIYGFASLSTINPIDLILPIYYIIFGVMVVAAEFRVQLILTYFRLLGSLFGKGCFYFFAGTLCLIEDFWLYYIVAILLVIVGCVYIGLHFCVRDDSQESKKESLIAQSN